MVRIRDAIAASITKYTGLRAEADPKDSVSPPCAVVLPAPPYVNYAVTMDGCLDFRFTVLLIISDAAPVEQTQRALDAMLSTGLGSNPASAVSDAIETDNTLGGLIDFIQAQTAAPPGRIEYAGVTYFGARLDVIASAR